MVGPWLGVSFDRLEEPGMHEVLLVPLLLASTYKIGTLSSVEDKSLGL